MARPTARILTLLEILQRGDQRTVGELAAELGVDERTVRRDVAHLRELDIPVTTMRGRFGGYRLAPGPRVPPLMLSEEQALAVMLGLVAVRRSGLLAAPSTWAAEEAASKVLRSLPTGSRSRLDALLESAEFSAPATEGVGAEARVLLLVATAARDRRPLWFQYTSREGRPSGRALQPYGVVAHGGRWYVTGHDSQSAEVRTFRLDRMAGATLLPGGFEIPPDFDPVATVLGSIATTPWTYEVSVLVQASGEELRRRLPVAVTTVEPRREAGEETGWTRVRLRAERLDWVAALLAGLDRDLVVERPDELRSALRHQAERLAAAAARGA